MSATQLLPLVPARAPHRARAMGTPLRGPSSWIPACAGMSGERSPALSSRGAAAPHIDAGEQEQPDHVDEVPVPGAELEAEMLGRGELAGHGTEQADDQESRADDDVGAMEAGRHEERGAVHVAGKVEQGV